MDDFKKAYLDEYAYHKQGWPVHHSNKWINYLKLVEVGREKNQKYEPLGVSDLFKQKCSKAPITRILIKGEAGIGKTTLCTNIVEGWAKELQYQQFDLLLLLPLRFKDITSVTSFPQLLRILFHETIPYDSFEMGGKRILIIADGWDEIDKSQLREGSFFHKLLFGYIPYVYVILTSRPAASASIYRHFDRFVEVCGFSEKNLEMYIQSEFSGDEVKADHLLKQVTSTPLVASVCSIPLNCAIICHLWHFGNEICPTTMTELYTKVVLHMLLRNMQKNDTSLTEVKIDALPPSIQQSWWLLCKLAFHALETEQAIFSHEYLIDFFPQGDIPTFGLLQYGRPPFQSDHRRIYYFHHVTIQEYLAALHIAKQPSKAQLKLLTKFNNHGLSMVLRFYAGIVLGKSTVFENFALESIPQFFQIVSNVEVESSSLQILSNCALECKSQKFNQEVSHFLYNKYGFYHPSTAYECAGMIYTVTFLERFSIGITIGECGMRDDQVLTLVDDLANKRGRVQINELNLYHCKLTDVSLSSLFHRGLCSFQSLEKLCLCGNFVETKTMNSILALTDMCCNTLTHLDLSHSALGVPEIQVLIDIVGKLIKLKELCLQGSLPDDADINSICLPKLMRAVSSHLAKLDISCNKLGASGLSTILKNSSGTQNLHIVMNESEVEDNAFLECLDGLHFPHKLELMNNNIHDSGACYIAYCVCSGKALMEMSSELYLDGNPLNISGAVAIGKVLSAKHCQFSRLSLSNCKLTTIGGTFLHKEDISDRVVDGVGHHFCHMPQNNALIRLNLDDNNFSGQGVHVLIGFLHLCPNLQWLSTNGCGITSDDFVELFVKLNELKSSHRLTKFCKDLQSWYLGCNKIDNHALSVVLDHLPSLLPSIQTIFLHNNPISVAMMEQLHLKLKSCEDYDEEIYEDSGIIVDIINKDGGVNKKLLVIGSEKDHVDTSHIDPGLVTLQSSGSRTTTGFQELDFLLNLCLAQIIVVEGHTGTGKTSLMEYSCQNSLNDFKFILYIHLHKSVQTLQELATELEATEMNKAGTRTLIVLDGLDELVRKENWQSTIFADILFRKTFPLSSILVCSRPSGLLHVRDCIYIDHQFKLKGLSVTNPSSKLNPLKFQEHWIIAMCEQHPVILELCQIPLIAELVCQFFRKEKADATLTDMLTYIVIEVMKREMKRQGHEIQHNLRLHDLPEDISSDFKNIGKLAFESLVSRNVFSNSDEVNRFLSAFHLNNSFAVNESECFGLVETVSDGQIEFLHPLIQQFLASYHLHMQPPLDQLVMIHQYVSKLLCQCDSVGYLLPFFFGLTWQKNSELDLNPTKLMFTTLIEFLASCFELEEVDRSIHNLTFILCIAETKDNELWKKLVTKLGSDLCLWLSSEDIKRHKWTIATMVSCSQVREWNINASNFGISDELELYIGVRLNKVEIPSMDRSVVTLSPRMGIEAASKKQAEAEIFSQYPDKIVAVMNHFQCRAVREILQRAFAMFANKIRLKGDSSNPAYVSFLSCGCFQNSLENNLRFCPYVPFHFLQVTSKKTLKKLQEEHGVHLAAKHDGKAVELVILLKPCMRRIIFSHKSREHLIVIMSEELAQNPIGKGAIACMVADIESTNTESCTVCTDESFSISKSEMVLPNLPLPSKIEENIRTATVLPQVITAETSHVPIPILHPIMHGVPEHEEPLLAQQQLLNRDTPFDNIEKGNGTSLGSGSPHMHHFPPPTPGRQHLTTTPTPMATQQTAHGKSNIKPGAVLFTSVPREIPADLIHPLPDETHQLRRGGNGQIFRGTIGGMNVVYKKTNYRSREYSIITKLNHKNIVRLLAFMYGEENPAHKRRHYCYHIMPQLTGDCARMLTDKKELTIRELHKKHGNNIRKMGIIRGNLKFLLKEILQGIRYLHSLRIAHRDIKGSNILLKFHCACTNPLECGCDTKYQAQICDFDAGVELDDSERLPHTLIGSKASSHPSRLQYTCVPVGTNGFRSPECSMLVISNSPDGFSPTITTRCDIWSLGILTIRMLIGATGPSTQRQMALLLLYYHRQRYMHEGLHKRGYLEVDRIVTDKLLSVPQLIQDVGWLKGAVRFVECCVAVDPLTRHSAEALLQHDFLY